MMTPCHSMLPRTVVTGIVVAALATAKAEVAEAVDCKNNPGAASCAAPWSATGGKEVCEDTPGWANGVDGCVDRGFKEADGCAPGGWTCAKYSVDWCQNGQAVRGMEFAVGEDFNSPNVHCCACGGGKRRAALSEATGHDKNADVVESMRRAAEEKKASASKVRVPSFLKCEQPDRGRFSNCEHYGGEVTGYNLRSCEELTKLLGGDTYNFGAEGSSHPGLCLVKSCRGANLMYETSDAFPGPWEVYSTTPCPLASLERNAVQNQAPSEEQAAPPRPDPAPSPPPRAPPPPRALPVAPVPSEEKAATDKQSAVQHMVSSEVEHTISSEGQEYFLDNRVLKSRARGIEYRLSKAASHRAGIEHYVHYGWKVRGVDEGDGWLRVGPAYLPMQVRDIQVLRPVSEEESAVPLAPPAPRCKDLANWSNGYISCAAEGYNVEQGCTPAGFTCSAYDLNGYCKNGKALPGKEWSQGEFFQNPEKHCCVCGGGTVVKDSPSSGH